MDIETVMGVQSRGMHDVMAERVRQRYSEGWTPKHDDAHVKGELAQAAASYTVHSVVIAQLAASGLPLDRIESAAKQGGVPRTWPWDASWWKPTDQRRNLVKAAALLIAEIERLDRAAAKAGA